MPSGAVDRKFRLLHDAKSPMHKPVSFKKALTFTNRLFDYFDGQAKHQQLLLQATRKNLPDHLAAHVLHSLVADNKLLIYTDSANWASQLRFYDRAIISSVGALVKKSDLSVQVKTLSKPVGPSQAQAERANPPSPENLAKMQTFCLAKESDNDLAAALLKLTNTIKHKHCEETSKPT